MRKPRIASHLACYRQTTVEMFARLTGVRFGFGHTGKVITYTPNSSGTYTAGRPASAKDVADSINYLTSATFAPQRALASLTNGSAIFGAFSYNPRLQPLHIFYGTNTPPGLTGSTCPSG